MLVIGLILSSCGPDLREIQVPDVTMRRGIVLKKSREQGPIHGLDVQVHGFLVGDATLVVELDGEPYHTIDLSGELSLSWHGDWYADDVRLVYDPRSVTSGKLVVSYRFLD